MLDVRVPYIYKNRETLLPWVKNWEDPQDQIRNLPIGKGGTDTINWVTWFWCHPSAYRLFTDSLYISGFFTTIMMGTLLGLFWSWNAAPLFYGLALLFGGFGLFKARKWKLYYGKTFYDTQMRDYPGDWVEMK